MSSAFHEQSNNDIWRINRDSILAAATYTFTDTERGSPLRQILVDGFCAMKFGLLSSSLWLEQFPVAFLADVTYQKTKLVGYAESLKDGLKRVVEWQSDNEEVAKGRKLQ